MWRGRVPPGPFGRQVTRAWAVHVLTMTGVVWACLAALALHEGQVAWMWLWLGIALLVDGIDGTLARKAEVSRPTVYKWLKPGWEAEYAAATRKDETSVSYTHLTLPTSDLV